MSSKATKASKAPKASTSTKPIASKPEPVKATAAPKGKVNKKVVVEDEEEPYEDEEEVYDSEDGLDSNFDSEDDQESDEDDDDEDGDDDDNDDDSDDDGFEKQSDSSEDDGDLEEEEGSSEEEEAVPVEQEAKDKVRSAETKPRKWAVGKPISGLADEDTAKLLNTDDLSSDDEEAAGNTIGRVPLHWYDAFDHIGYDVSGNKVVKRKGKDRLDQAISNNDNTDISKRTIYDMYNDKEVIISERDMELIRRIQAGAFAHPEFNDTPEYVDYFSSIKEVMPLSSRPEAKHKFLPSRYEITKIRNIVRAIRAGRYKTIAEREQEKIDAQNNNKDGVYMIWNDQEDDIIAESNRYKYHLPAPKMPLPGHAESYNPPAEYLLTEDEIKELEDQDPSERQYNFIPKAHSCLRHVAGYKDFVKERFERCLDLYLCPRKVKMRLNIDPQTLVPKLPKPRELKPFPNTLCLQYLGHKKAVRCISVSPDGQYLASGSEDCTVRLWEVDTALCRRVWHMSGPVSHLCWNPNPQHALLAAAVDKFVVLIATGTGDSDSVEMTDSLLNRAVGIASASNQRSDVRSAEPIQEDEEEEEEADESNSSDEVDSDKEANSANKKSQQVGKKAKAVAKWRLPNDVQSGDDNNSIVGARVVLELGGDVTHFAWHHKGDYLATVADAAKGSHVVAIHQLSQAKSQYPFKNAPGKVQAISFHPHRPFIFVVTQQHVRVFHLIEQQQVKKLLSGCKWLSCIDVHPSGDHIIMGSYDRRVVWFDMDLSSKPYKTLKFHEKAVRSVHFHRRYPLMATASDDGTVHVFHSTVYSDLTRNPLIVPLKILRGHGVVGGLGVLSVSFHPKQPWVFTSGSDGVINMFQDI